MAASSPVAWRGAAARPVPLCARRCGGNVVTRTEPMAEQPFKDIAVLITCVNRRETPPSYLPELKAQELPPGYSLRIFLTDDGSSDGTGDAVRREFPQVTVLQGDGQQYWVGGTMMAWEAA